MQLDHLTAFIHLAHEGSINKACRTLNTSPQNLSRILKQMETELDTELFVRTKHGVSITENGYLFLGFCKNTLSEFENVCFQMSRHNNNKDISGTIYFSTTNLLMELFFNTLIFQFNQIYPNVHFNSIEVDTLDGYHLLNDNPNMIGAFPLLSSLEKYPLLKYNPFTKLSCMLMIGLDHPLASKKSVSISEALQYKIVFFARKNFYDTEGAVLLAPYLSSDTDITITGNLNAYYNYVASGKYICFITKEGYLNQSLSLRQQTKIIEISNMETTLNCGLISNLSNNLTSTQQQWLNFLQSHLF